MLSPVVAAAVVSAVFIVANKTNTSETAIKQSKQFKKYKKKQNKINYLFFNEIECCW